MRLANRSDSDHRHSGDCGITAQHVGKNGGMVWESNPPGTRTPHRGFEGQEPHRRPHRPGGSVSDAGTVRQSGSGCGKHGADFSRSGPSLGEIVLGRTAITD